MKERYLLEDLFLAYYDARKNKRNTINQLRFEMNLERNLFDLYTQILERSYEHKPSVAFIVFKPVQREVFAADFSDRVIHHLYFNYTNHLFERTYIEDCYSCRQGKGTHYAVKRLDHHIRACSANYTRPCFVLKLDVQGYFMSINRTILYNRVRETLDKFATRDSGEGLRWNERIDYDLVDYLARRIIFHDPTKNYHMKGSPADWEGLPPQKSMFHSPEGCGLPIGNLTSQLFSNVYMAGFDNYVKRELKMKHYGRYVDDFYFVDTDRDRLKAIIPIISDYLWTNLRLTVHPRKIYLQRYENGVLFTGGFIKPHRIHIGNRVKTNLYSRLFELKDDSNLSPATLRNSLNSYLGIMKHYSSFNVRRKVMQRHTWVKSHGTVEDPYTVFYAKDDTC